MTTLATPLAAGNTSPSRMGLSSILLMITCVTFQLLTIALLLSIKKLINTATGVGACLVIDDPACAMLVHECPIDNHVVYATASFATQRQLTALPFRAGHSKSTGFARLLAQPAEPHLSLQAQP
jgi:hypothetical protein